MNSPPHGSIGPTPSRSPIAVSTDVHGKRPRAVLNPGAAMRIMLAGHMDELGFIVHHIDDKGSCTSRTIGGHDSAVAVGQRLWIYGKQRIPGVIGRTAIHLQGRGGAKAEARDQGHVDRHARVVARRGGGYR